MVSVSDVDKMMIILTMTSAGEVANHAGLGLANLLGGSVCKSRANLYHNSQHTADGCRSSHIPRRDR